MERVLTRLVTILQAAVIAVLAVLFFVANADPEHCLCDPFTHCDDCDPGSCCSPVRYCGSTGAYCDPNYCGRDICYNPPLHLNLPDGHRGQHRVIYYNGTTTGATVVNATYSHELDIDAAEVSCGSSRADMPSSSGWAAFCTSTGLSEDVCGLCLKVTNRNNGKRAKVRIVHKQYCSNGSLVLDYNVFQQLDTSDHGRMSAHLPISYEFVNCIS